MGQRHFDLGEYEDAISNYREAYRIDPRPGLLFNLGQAYRLKGDCVSARTMYRSYLRLEPGSKYRDIVEQNLASIDACAREQAAAGRRPADDPSAGGDEADPGRGRRIAGLVAIGGGVALGAVGTWFALDARSAAREVSDFYEEGGQWQDIADVDARGHRSQKLAIGCFAAGGIAIVAGFGLYVLGYRSEHAAQVAIVPAPGGGTMGMSWTW